MSDLVTESELVVSYTVQVRLNDGNTEKHRTMDLKQGQDICEEWITKYPDIVHIHIVDNSSNVVACYT
jgi:hypothetical protein